MLISTCHVRQSLIRAQDLQRTVSKSLHRQAWEHKRSVYSKTGILEILIEQSVRIHFAPLSFFLQSCVLKVRAARLLGCLDSFLSLWRRNEKPGGFLSFYTLAFTGSLSPMRKWAFPLWKSASVLMYQLQTQFIPAASVFGSVWYLSHASPPPPHVCLRLVTCCHTLTGEKIHTDTKTVAQQWHFLFLDQLSEIFSPKSPSRVARRVCGAFSASLSDYGRFL